jgi:aldehyde dehydrogenase (NAD(P)+)
MDPIISKPVQGELGCITPWIIVPGEWDEKQVQLQASKMAFWMVRNEGYLCYAPRILVLYARWPQRQAFLDALIKALTKVTPIRAYYPGSAKIQKTFVEAHPEALEIGGHLDDHVPWTVIPGLDPMSSDELCFRREAFLGLCGEVTLEAPTVQAYIEEAVNFLNTKLWGTLSVTIVVDENQIDSET